MKFTQQIFARLTSLVVVAVVLITGCSKEDNEMNESASRMNGQIIPGQYIVVFEKGALNWPSMKQEMPHVDRVAFVREEAIRILSEYELDASAVMRSYGTALEGAVINMSREAADRLKNDRRVKSIEPDRLIIMGPPGGKGKPPADGGGDPPAEVQETPYGITRMGGSVDGTGKTAWIIDTGVDLDHPDLNVDISRCVTMFTSGKDSKSADDGNGHGTHVAGTIAAINNAQGVIGVAAGATVIGVKVLDARGSGSYSIVIAGVDHVAAYASAGDVANMSLSGPSSQALNDAVIAAASNGIGFALAAGNASEDAINSSPASANGANIYTITAMNEADVFASFSNFGNPPVDYCAPGVSVKSTWKGGGYNTISGTSMAAPHAAGVLLVTNLSPASSGNVINDPDGTPDAIIHR